MLLDLARALIRIKLPHVISFRLTVLSAAEDYTMTGAYAYTPAIWPPLVATLFLAAIGLYAWRHRDVPGGKPFVAMSALSILILLGIAFEAAALVTATKLTWYKFQFVVLLVATIPVTCFVLDYAYPGRWLTRRNLILLSIPPLLCLLAAAIDDSQLIWRRLELGADGWVTVQYAPAGAILLAYGLGLYLLYATVFLWLFVHSPQHRWPVALMLLGQVTSRTVFLLDNAHLPALSPFDLSVFVVVLPWTMYVIALFGFHLLDPRPAARQTVIEQMHSGVVVFDSRWQVVSMNPASEGILGVRAGIANGKTWQQLASSEGPLPALPDAGMDRAGAATAAAEMTFGSGPDARHYTLTLSPLKDFRGLLMGHLLMLNDVTEERRAQDRILEQQRVMATLHERERLGRELHDSAGQILAYVSMQAQAIAKRVHDDDSVTAEAQLRRLAEAAQEAHADIRESILALKVGPAGEWSFLGVLRQYLVGFSDHSGIAAELAIQPELEVEALPPNSGVQLLRVIQEALTNARQHSGARCVRVALAREDGEAVIVVQDDGVGFKPGAYNPKQQTPGSRSDHYGLNYMAERMAEIGGRLAIESEPGAGTRIVLHAPFRPTREEGV